MRDPLKKKHADSLRIQRVQGKAARLGHSIGEEITSTRAVDEDGILGQTSIPPEEGHISLCEGFRG